ncbi:MULTISPECIES: hypothetical protein [unclassified Streptomyces]|uniref:hypothetical protein n=1 Tax=unclassified Streptomyces TaxID=2593676 RepID=UPI001C2167D3|nr:hypothetical protein [Streptomyces sp. AC558_RSS880]
MTHGVVTKYLARAGERDALADCLLWAARLLDLFRWLHRYNTVRRHSRLGHRSPVAYERALQTTSTTLAEAA